MNMALRATAVRERGERWLGCDPLLLCGFLALLAIGVLAVASASVGHASEHFGDSMFYTKRHIAFMLVGFVVVAVLIYVPLNFWYRMAPFILLASFILLALVLIPGIGIERNGARRWLGIGSMTVQSAELAKGALIIYLASYLVRQRDSLSQSWDGILKPFAIMGLYLVLLLAQPDFGSIVVMASVTLAMLFLGGIHFLKFLSIAVVGVGGLAMIATSSDYRLQRITSYMDPWADQFNSGYQLTQSLIAFGRGEFAGVGLGNSIQKLLYLPEAHTDFIFAVIAEETGLLGSFIVVGLLALLIGRLLTLGVQAVNRGEHFGGFVAIGVAAMLALQSFVNIGVACGLLPTKGLTLPFISAGGSSLVVNMALVGICLRLSRELPDTAGRVASEVKI